VIALQTRAIRADTVTDMARHHDITDRRRDEPRDARPAPAWPLSASKVTAARRRDLTAAILRARQA
jgi:hypothetical protein